MNAFPVPEPGSLSVWERRTTRPLVVAAVLFLFVLTVPVIDPRLPTPLRALLHVADVGIWVLFAVDYVVRVALAPQRGRYVRAHLPDLAMVMLPALRPLRILRLLSLGNLLARRSARSLIADTGLAVSGTSVLVVYLGAVGVLDAERGAPHANITSFGDAVWWSCSTITSVGYGDRYPVTVTGRVLAVLLMVIGIALLSLLTAGIAAWFVRQSQEAAEARTAVLVGAQVEALSASEAAGQRHIDVELGEVLDGLARLNARLVLIQQQAATR